MKQKKSKLGQIYGHDHCFRYYPRFDNKAFQQQLEYTQKQIINYFPSSILAFNDQFIKTGRNINIIFWTIDILFVAICHKIKFINRILGNNTWKLFAFKGLFIGMPFFFLSQLQKNAEQLHNQELYRQVKKFYKRYKQTSDILDLNRHVYLENQQTQLQKICKLNQFKNLHGSQPLL